MIPEFVDISGARQNSEDIYTLYLDRPNFTFSPGQFNMLYAFGKGEIPISIAGYSDNKIAHTIRAVGSVSDALCKLREGDQLGLRGPFGSAWPQPDSSNIVIVAGGLGIAPLSPTIEYLYTNYSSFNNIHLVYGTRSPDDMIYHQTLKRWAGQIKIHQTVDMASRKWHGHVGNVISVLDRLTLDWPQTEVYLCGPEVMMRFAARDVLAKGVMARKTYLSFERNMKCALGHCGHCQFGPKFVCKDGPVFSYPQIENLWKVREL